MKVNDIIVFICLNISFSLYIIAVLVRTREAFGPPTVAFPLPIIETLTEGKQIITYIDNHGSDGEDINDLLHSADIRWDIPTERLMGEEKANYDADGFISVNYFQVVESEHYGGCGMLGLTKGSGISVKEVLRTIGGNEKYSFLLDMADQMKTPAAVAKCELPQRGWLTTDMMIYWTSITGIVILVVVACSNRQGWQLRFATYVGEEVNTINRIVCLRSDGLKFDSIVPLSTKGYHEMVRVYRHARSIASEDGFIQNIPDPDGFDNEESVDSRLAALPDVLADVSIDSVMDAVLDVPHKIADGEDSDDSDWASEDSSSHGDEFKVKGKSNAVPAHEILANIGRNICRDSQLKSSNIYTGKRQAAMTATARLSEMVTGRSSGTEDGHLTDDVDNSDSDIPDLNSCVSSDSNDSGTDKDYSTDGEVEAADEFQEPTVVEESEQWLGNDAGEEELDDGDTLADEIAGNMSTMTPETSSSSVTDHSDSTASNADNFLYEKMHAKFDPNLVCILLLK